MCETALSRRLYHTQTLSYNVFGVLYALKRCQQRRLSVPRDNVQATDWNVCQLRPGFRPPVAGRLHGNDAAAPTAVMPECLRSVSGIQASDGELC